MQRICREEKMAHPLSDEIRSHYEKLIAAITPIPPSERTLQRFEGTGGPVSAADLIAYQIGWGQCLLRWYEAGRKGETPEMPGEGFSKWDYVAIAKHFYKKYHLDGGEKQMHLFAQTVSALLKIVEEEEKRGRLEQIGAWDWCTLPSGKQWPLSKWIRVNTASPYKKATQLLRKGLSFKESF